MVWYIPRQMFFPPKLIYPKSLSAEADILSALTNLSASEQTIWKNNYIDTIILLCFCIKFVSSFLRKWQYLIIWQHCVSIVIWLFYPMYRMTPFELIFEGTS